ncbi:GNAT family N-acetyltransferase [Mesobacillus jeotgali]|uniref:GNAT family N-acetyltransferase n=1 Tax=Mesobacillus jeotgali TaxID=129985 RepID=UPI0009A8392B|nr:GNAT family N-acetyltransferase [Mesobacillus jeotgali]
MKIRRLKNEEQPPWNLILSADPSREMAAKYLKKGSCYVAVSDNEETLGVIVLLPIAGNRIEIKNLAVAEPAQRKGIGKSLINYGIQAARNEGFEVIEIGTGNSSINQLALYQKAGFRITGIDKDFFLINYPEPIFENGIQCRDMIRLSKSLMDQTM